MKSKRIMWKNNSILYAEHMNKFCDLIENEYECIFSNVIRYGYGINKIQIDELQLSSGILSINYISGIFSDGTSFEYNSSENSYKIAIDLTSFSEELFYSAKKFYIIKDHEHIEECKQIISESEEIIPIIYGDTKLKITDDLSGNIGFSVVEVFIKGGAFNLKEFCPPLIKVQKTSILGNNIGKLILFLRQTILTMKDQLILNENYILRMLLKDINECLVNINVIFINELSPFDLYCTLCSCIGKISWNSLLMPNIPVYDHNNSYYVIQKLISLLTEIVTSSRSGYERIEFTRENDVFTAMISELGEEDVLLTIEPNNADTKQWIENTIITSKSFFDEFQTRRFPGIPRQIIDENQSEIVVKLDKFSNYFVTGEQLVIFIGGNKNISNLSFYFKKNSLNI